MDLIELLPQLHLLRFEVGQAYLWQDQDSLTLIDTGTAGSGPAVLDAIGSLGRDPAELSRLVLTHFHGDHTGSAAEIRSWHGAEVLAHRADAPIVRGEAPPPHPELLDWEWPLFEQVKGHLTGPPVPTDRELEDGDLLDFGGGAKVLAIPGHTEGSLALHLPEHGVLFTGDTVANVEGPMLGVFNQDRARTVESFRRLAALDSEIACFGHGDPLTGDAATALRRAAAALPGDEPVSERG
ncbi:MBL fold metallo-hydrolase [Amycolatopsis nigrescens]|uniref:MBL fold metallo-hydrolase n=1 Tax=Amycolatopsis nigrescens TaxID=381445 RepID=UPI0003807472|nr:MBL fold metallo-hydrolase [Amycolatopsis nigrescens]